MSHASALPRRHESSLRRNRRGTAPGSAGSHACVEVQWRFLAPRSAACPAGRPRRADGGRSPPIGSAGVDYYYYYGARPEAASPATYQRQREATESSRVLDGLTGETQRQVALDRIMAEMQGLLAQPRASPPLPEGAKSPSHERRKRSSVLLDTLKASDGGVSLLPQRKRSTLGVIADSRGRVADDAEEEEEEEEEVAPPDADRSQDQAALGRSVAAPPRQKWKSHDAGAERELQFVWQQSAASRLAADLPRRLDPSAELKASSSPRPPDAAAPAPRAIRAPYGAWYIPQRHWWPLRRLEQQAADEADGREPAPTPPAAHGHCHRGSSTAQRRHKPPLPPASPTRSGGPCASPPPSSPPADRPTAAPSSSSLTGVAATEVQLAGSYIGREYRRYVVATGSPLPHYLK